MLALAAATVFPVNPAAAQKMKIGLAAMISPVETSRFYNDLLKYIEKKTGIPIETVITEKYADMNTLLERGDVKAAFICSGPYVKLRRKANIELLVAPVSNGRAFYNAYIIVNRHSAIRTLSDLKGKTFAFTDPDSNTGRLVPEFMLARDLKVTAARFFSRILYTGSHDRSIDAVAKSQIDGASVDSLVYDYMAKKNAIYASMTRIIATSDSYGIPPVVVGSSVEERRKTELRNAFLNMHKDLSGREILDRLMIDRFIVPSDADYNTIREMEQFLEGKK